MPSILKKMLSMHNYSALFLILFFISSCSQRTLQIETPNRSISDYKVSLSSYEASEDRLPDDLNVSVFKNVVYGEEISTSQCFDAYIVDSDTPSPVLFHFHGGGWIRGSKSPKSFFSRNSVYMEALREGISVISVEYRFTQMASHPAQVNDATRALQFVRYHGTDWNLDPNRIVLSGDSCGGHLASWLGLHDDLADPDSSDPVERQSTRVQGIIAIAALLDLEYFDFEKIRDQLLGSIFPSLLGCTMDEFMQSKKIRERLHDISPINLVTHDDPEVILVYVKKESGINAKPPDKITDPHSEWFGVKMKKALEENNVAYQDYIKRSREHRNRAVRIVSYLKRMFGMKK